jgi:hypothetical protein
MSDFSWTKKFVLKECEMQLGYIPSDISSVLISGSVLQTRIAQRDSQTVMY